MFNNNNETNDDDDLFVPTASSSSNLAHLFGAQAQQDLKSTLTYTPPKQPKQADNQQQQGQQLKKLVCVKTITLSKLLDGSFSTLGKFGIAIIADQISADLILYKTKQTILSTTKLSSLFHYKVHDLSFTFTDDQTITWMVSFECNKDKMDFIAELTKQEASERLEPNITQASSDSGSFSTRLIAEKPEEEKTRADILGRMSKLGMSILPSTESPLPAISSSKLSSRLEKEKELSESEPEEVIRTTKLRKMRGRHSESAIESMDLVPKPSASAQFTPFAANVQHVTLGHQLMDPLNIYFAESRTHNSEVRMNLTQLGGKIDTLLQELRPQRNSSERDFLERRIIDLERKLDHQGHATDDSQLQAKLEQQIKENAQNILKYNEVISNLKQENQALKTTLETERHLKADELEVSNEKVSSLTETNSELHVKAAELEALVENQKLKLADFGDYYKKDQESKLDRMARDAAEKELQQRAEFLQASLDESNKKIEELELLYQQVLASRTKEEDIFADLVKETMNVMYQSVLTDSIDSTTNLDVRDLKKILQKHLKSTTFSIINQYSKRKDIDNLAPHEQKIASVSPEFEVTV